MSVPFCVSFLAFYLQTAPFMSYLCIGKTKEKLPRAHEGTEKPLKLGRLLDY